jgi:hypothetical protein
MIQICCVMLAAQFSSLISLYSETSIHRFCRGSEKETIDPGKQ